MEVGWYSFKGLSRETWTQNWTEDFKQNIPTGQKKEFVRYPYFEKDINKKNIRNRMVSKLINVGGSSGVGKTTLTTFLSFLFDGVYHLKGDDLHKWEKK